MAQCGAAALCADDPPSGGADRRELSGGHQHAAGAVRTRRVVPGRGRQGRGQPHRHRFAMAAHQGGLGGLEPALAGRDEIVRLILDGTVVRVRLDRKATSVSLLVVLGVRSDGQKVLLSVRAMGGESEAAWRTVLDDLIARGLRRPDFLIIDGGAGLERALAALWPTVPTQRCTVHKHRNLLAHAPERLHEEITADYTDMIYAESAREIEARRRAFLRKWRLKCPAVATSLEEAGDRLFTFTRLPPSQWRSARITYAMQRLHEELKRHFKTPDVPRTPEPAAMLFWALLASGQITMRKVDGWQTLAESPADLPVDLAA